MSDLAAGLGPTPFPHSGTRAERLREFQRRLRSECIRRGALPADVANLSPLGLCELVIELRKRDHLETARLMQPGYGR